jgi:hypothetical protein
MEALNRRDVLRDLPAAIPKAEHLCRALDRSLKAFSELKKFNQGTHVLKLAEQKNPEFGSQSPLEVIIEAYLAQLKESISELRSVCSQRDVLRAELFLVLVVEDLRAITGKPQFSDLAYVLEVAYLANRKRKDVPPDTVEKAYKRFRDAWCEWTTEDPASPDAKWQRFTKSRVRTD